MECNPSGSCVDDTNMEKEESTINFDPEKHCLICKEILTPKDSKKLDAEALKIAISASRRRLDYKFRIMEEVSDLTLHKYCYLVYKGESHIKKAAEQNKLYYLSMREYFMKARPFDYNKCCFFCQSATPTAMLDLKSMVTVERISDNIKSGVLDEAKKLLSARLKIIKEKYGTIHPVYHSSCYNKFFNYKVQDREDQSATDDMTNVLDFVIKHITENLEECQFSLTEILANYNGNVPEFSLIKTQLESHFKDEVKIFEFKGDLHICSRAAGNNVFGDDWYTNRKTNPKEERMRIMEAAAHILLQDVRSHYYDVTQYKNPSSFMNNVDTSVPETLKSFLRILISTHKKSTDENNEKLNNQILTAAHVLIANTRPRTFLSQILLGISLKMHRKHTSREIIDSLANLNLCAPYNETVLFEEAILKSQENFSESPNSIVRFLFENIDCKTTTDNQQETFLAKADEEQDCSNVHSVGCDESESGKKTDDNVPDKEVPSEMETASPQEKKIKLI